MNWLSSFPTGSCYINTVTSLTVLTRSSIQLILVLSLFVLPTRAQFTEMECLTGVNLGSSSVADVNNDGNEDVLITGSDTSNEVSARLYVGDGNGSFSKAKAGLPGVQYSSSAFADFDEDGYADLVMMGWIRPEII